MSVIRRILLGSSEERNLNGLGLLPQAFDRVPSLTIQRVDPKSVLGLSTAWACVRILSDLTSTMPIDSFRRDQGQRRPYRPGGVKPNWITQPVPNEVSYSIQSVISEIVTSLMLSGNAYVYAPRDPETLEPLMVKVLHPESVTITRTNGKLQYIVRNSDQVEGSVYGPETILHIPLIRLPGADYGLSPLDALRNTFALGLTVEEYAQRFFATGSTPTGVIEVADSSLTPDQVKAIKEGWIRHHTGANMHTPGVLVGATFKALSFRPEDAQLLGSREFTVNEIARIYRVPPALLAVTTPGAMSYGSVEQLSEDFVRFTLRPLAELIERALSTLIPLPEAFVKLNMDSLLRGSTEARYNAYAKGLASGWLSVSEIRRSEDLSPIDDEAADAYRQPLNEADASLAAARQKADILGILVRAGYDPADAAKIIGLDVKHTGAVPVTVSTDPNA